MKKMMNWILDDYIQSNFSEYYRARLLVWINVAGVILISISFGRDLITGDYLISFSRKVLLPIIAFLIFAIDLLLIKYSKNKSLPGIFLVISLLGLILSISYLAAAHAGMDYFYAMFYYIIAVFVLGFVFATRQFVVINTVLVLLGFNLIYYHLIPNLSDEHLLHYAKASYINFQLTIVGLAIVMIISRGLSENLIRKIIEVQNGKKKFTIQLKGLINSIMLVIDDLKGISIALLEYSEKIGEASAKQASEIEEISSTVEELSTSLSQTNETSMATNNFAKKMNRFVSDSLTNFEKTEDAILRTIDKSSQIEEIAVKTEILSINSAIEVARVVDSKSGLFNVSEEIRKLSQLTLNTAENITSLVKYSHDLSVNSTSNINIIKDLITDLGSKINSISHIINEQKNRLNELNQGILDINSIAQLNVPVSENLREIVGKLNSVSENLKDIIE